MSFLEPSKRFSVGKRVRFLIFDGVTVIPILFALPRPSLLKLEVALGFCLAMWLIERKGMRLPMVGRYFRTLLVGRRRRIRSIFRYRPDGQNS